MIQCDNTQQYLVCATNYYLLTFFIFFKRWFNLYSYAYQYFDIINDFYKYCMCTMKGTIQPESHRK